MKDKIIAELKTVYAKLGLSDEVFDGVASLLEKTVTEESAIATAVRGDDVRGMLTTIQGQTDSWKNKFYDKQKELTTYKESHPDKKTGTGEGGEEDDPESKRDKALMDKLDAITARLDKADLEKKQATMLTSIRQSLKNAGCSNEGILELVLKGSPIGEKETEEDAVKRLTEEYNAASKSIIGKGVTPPAGGAGGSGEDDEATVNRRKAWVAQHQGEDSEKNK